MKFSFVGRTIPDIENPDGWLVELIWGVLGFLDALAKKPTKGQAVWLLRELIARVEGEDRE